MIIECPACTTRYDIKADLPSEGRTVRCAKCGTVWRAMPESGGEEVAVDESSWVSSSKESERARDEALAAQTTHDHFAAAGGDDERQWSSGRGVAVKEELAAADETNLKEDVGEPHQDPGLGKSDTSEEHENSGKVSWFSGFRRRKTSKQTDEAEEAATETPSQVSADTIPFPRASIRVAQQGPETIEEDRALDATRHAVRKVFSGLGHGRSVVTAAMSGDGEGSPVPAKADDGWAERLAESSDRFRRASGGTGDWGLSEADRKGGVNAQGERHFDAGEDDAWPAEKQGDANGDSDPDFSLREAMRSHFLFPANRTHGAPSLADEELAEKLETHLKSTAATSTEEARPSGIADLWGKSSRSAEEETFEPEPVVAEEPAEVRDDDTAFDQRLYREIEETQEKSDENPRRRRRGGLALAAAWGLFICVASGLIVGFFAFRDIIADAAPGLASLYRTLGMPVTAQPLVFESVQYEWSASENRPVLTVRGSVFNRAHRSVRVPQFFITVKDQDPALDRDYSANLRITGTKISSNERADFDIELVSPNTTVTAVELELRNVH
jgi:predicted Zn finger-like uncharacterized protein